MSEPKGQFLPLTLSMDNVHAMRVGRAMDAAASHSRGDLIDAGLAAVKEFDQAGYYIIPKDGNKSFFTGTHQARNFGQCDHLLAELKRGFENILWEPKPLVWREILRSNKEIARLMIDKIEQAASAK